MNSNDVVHPIFSEIPPPDAKLWRYLSFAKFASLLHSQKLHFTRVDRLDDHFEGVWPRSDLEYWQQPLFRTFDVPSFTKQFKCNVAASCWVESPHESAAMWRLYTPGEEGVAITTTFGKLQSLVKTVGEDARWLADAARVMYIDHFNEGLIKNLGKGERLPNLLAPFMLKNISYAHEKEVRALVVSRPDEIGSDGFDLQISLNDFVDEIVGNPFCQTWFTDVVAGLADRYNLGSKRHRSALSPDIFYMTGQERKG